MMRFLFVLSVNLNSKYRFFAKRLFFMFFVLVFPGIYPLKRFLFLLGYGGLVGVGEEGEAAREAEKQ